MSIELTDDQIRQFLEDLGLPQVDPTAFRAGTLPELLRGSIDLGRIRPVLRTTQLVVIAHVGLPVMVDNFTLVAPAPNQIVIVRNLNIFFTNALTNTLVIEKTIGPVEGNVWTDFGGPFAFGPYIGTDNDATRAWGNKTLYVYGVNPDATNLQQQLNMELQDPVGVGKDVQVTFDADFYEWEDWPGGT